MAPQGIAIIRWHTPVRPKSCIYPHGEFVRRAAVSTESSAYQRPSSYSREHIAYTKEVWEPYYGRRLTDGEAEEIIRNVVHLYRVLAGVPTAENQEESE